MQDLYIFEYSDPKDPKWPDIAEGYFDQCASFSMNTLENRTANEIALTMKDIDLYVSNTTPYEVEGLHCVNPEYRMTEYYYGTSTGRRGFVRLLQLYKNNDKSIFKHIDNPSWSEIFSIYTLGRIAYLNRDVARMKEDKILKKIEYLVEVISMYMAETMEASTVAYFINKDFLPIEELENTIHFMNNSKKKIAKKGGDVRAEKYRILKDIVISEYVTGPYQEKSNNQSAREIWRKIPNEKKIDNNGLLILADHSAVSQVSRWIGQYKRSL